MDNLLRNAFPKGNVLRVDTLRKVVARSKLYIVFFTPRSGSTWLTELAQNTGVLGVPQEWFNHTWIYSEDESLGCRPPLLRGTTDINEYVDSIVNEGNGVAGIELSTYQAIMLRELLDKPLIGQMWSASFYLRRRDIVAQAVSLYRSIASSRFHSFQNSSDSIYAYNTVSYSYMGIRDALYMLIDCERRFDLLFKECNFYPEVMFYEDLMSDQLKELNKICLNIGVQCQTKVPNTSVSIMRDSHNTLWIERFISDLPPDLIDAIQLRACELCP